MAIYYAIGDIHGRFDLLEDLHGQIQKDISASFRDRADVRCVFLGDYIDRGPRSNQVIEFLMNLDGCKNAVLPGNHESMLAAYLTAETDGEILQKGSDWIRNGGLATLASYASGRDHPVFDPFKHRLASALKDARNLIPNDHREWLLHLASSKPYFSDREDGWFFVHAGIDPRKRLHEHLVEELLWTRNKGFMRGDEWAEGMKVCHGHTPSRGVVIKDRRVGVDTMAFRSGTLSSIVIIDGVVDKVIQAIS